MVQRDSCLLDGKIVGIETIYTIIGDKQINIPEKLAWLRRKSRANALFCPCGCGANLILVAGDNNLREQHFRIKDKAFEKKCTLVTEGKTSIDSKIVLKCWLDDVLKAEDLESRVPVSSVSDSGRKYEYTFLSVEKKIGVNYCHDRRNLNAQKIALIEQNDISVIHIVDEMNAKWDEQYPEGMMKVQEVQGYCLMLSVNGREYKKAEMMIVIYDQNADGLWEQLELLSAPLSDYSISFKGEVFCKGFSVKDLADNKRKQLAYIRDAELKRREEAAKRAEEQKRAWEEKKREEQLLREEYERRSKEEQQRRMEEMHRQIEEYEGSHLEKQPLSREEEEKRKDSLLNELEYLNEREKLEDFKESIRPFLENQEKMYTDGSGQRWVMCEFCKKISQPKDFIRYGGKGHINLGTCYECNKNNPKAKEVKREQKILTGKEKNTNACPECGGVLRKRNGKNGEFWGCSNFPRCKYTRNITASGKL